VVVQLNDNPSWAFGISVANALQGQGKQVWLGTWAWRLFAPWLRPTGQARAALVFASPKDPHHPSTGVTRLSSPDGTVLMWAVPLPPGVNAVPTGCGKPRCV
jgi:hypothetical protein